MFSLQRGTKKGWDSAECFLHFNDVRGSVWLTSRYTGHNMTLVVRHFENWRSAVNHVSDSSEQVPYNIKYLLCFPAEAIFSSAAIFYGWEELPSDTDSAGAKARVCCWWHLKFQTFHLWIEGHLLRGNSQSHYNHFPNHCLNTAKEDAAKT